MSKPASPLWFRAPRAIAVLAAMWWSAPALGGPAGYQICCAKAGAACPVTLQATGPGTTFGPGGGGLQAVGLWDLACGSATFRPELTAPVAQPLAPGTVLTPIGASGAACFDALCALPPEVCVTHDGEGARVVTCGGVAAPPEAAWRQTPTEDTTAVVVGGRVLKAKRATVPVSPPVGALPSAAPRPPAVVASPTPAAPPPVVVRMVAPPASSAPAAVWNAPAAGAPTAAMAPAPGVPASAGLDFTLPSAPPDPCTANPAMRDPSNQQVDQGNEAIVAGQPAVALNKYRAAITINSCNAFAWSALGDALLGASRPIEARAALEVATRLMPSHFQAWTSLGRAAESSGDRERAIVAYQRALAHRPGHAPAQQGLDRLR